MSNITQFEISGYEHNILLAASHFSFISSQKHMFSDLK